MNDYINDFDRETVESYNDMLDCEGTVTVCGMEFNPSDILLNCDPVAYRCGLIDYADSIEE